MTEKKPSLQDLKIDEQARDGGRMRLLSWLIIGPLLVAGGVAAWWWLGGQSAVSVRAEEVVESLARGAAGSGGTADGAVLNASGYVTARRRATVSSKVTGKVREVHVEEGMAVREGQVLARLDDSTVKAYLGVAEAELAAARRNLAETEVRIREAGITLKRTRSLAADGIAHQADLDAAQASVDALEARLVAAREQVVVAERQIDVRRTELDDMVIRAPFSGVAISKDAQPGEMVSPISAGGGFTRTGICTIVDMTSLEIEVDVNESYINRVVPAQKIEATLDAYPDWRIPGHVITTVPTADRQKATVLVRIGFEKLDPRILPDMGIKVAFLSQPSPGGVAAQPRRHLVIPRGAVRGENGQDVVFLVRDGRAIRRAVVLGPADGDRLEVTSGLSVGDRVIVEGPKDLADGRKVVIQ